MRLGIIGDGAIGKYVRDKALERGHVIRAATDGGSRLHLASGATGDFGSFSFDIRGHSLPDNPRSSALAAMSVISKLEQETQRIIF